MFKNEKRRLSLCALLLTFALLAGIASDGLRLSGNLRENVLRLHVIANSDLERDQTVKLLVRDALLEKGADLFDGSVTSLDAEARSLPQTHALEKEARRVLKEQGCDYGARVTVTTEFFDTRAYGDLTFPAGTYRAVKVVLGEGKGRNWWCVMFPPLCLPAAQKRDGAVPAFSGEDARFLQPQKGYRLRFKLAELWEELKEMIKEEREKRK